MYRGSLCKSELAQRKRKQAIKETVKQNEILYKIRNLAYTYAYYRIHTYTCASLSPYIQKAITVWFFLQKRKSKQLTVPQTSVLSKQNRIKRTPQNGKQRVYNGHTKVVDEAYATGALQPFLVYGPIKLFPL
uniref:Uncharacterized protein n=1 Tax=Sphaerodactylus townsendi TaxID=933632 RepID=A0ACB8FYQ9_9SAUR